ncbi:vWA domain-containing protein [Spongiivirga citrea]|uniref:VWA domain-containing protein n=1 Tax=Spongiivirga citrea TaxID=1481457 RepID=A0A6M0CJY4_9FLAO|nr:vWA domain-containing protein [Spongiivirga citrea]NER18258.1 VWA domain-containing protein [Spongiivirga citrea]
MKNRITYVLMLVGLLQINSLFGNHSPRQKKLHKPVVEESYKQTIQVALLLDTSNSMDGLINQAKAQLWEIVNQLSYAKCRSVQPNLEIALYEYGNDRLSSREGYIKQVIGFSNDLDEISEKLFSLTTNGGSEFCGQVINTSIKQLDWGKNDDDLRMVFIAGNEPFNQGRLSYKDAITDAKEKDIVVNTIYCGDYRSGVQTHWKDGADLGRGDYMNIDHNRAVVHISTPYDDIIIQLNSKLNNTYVPYGSYGVAKSIKQRAQDSNAAELDEVVSVKRAVTKSGRLYNNSQWDLVDAEKEDDFSYAKIEKKKLPKELQDKSTAQLKAYVATKSAERKKIQKEIQDLNKKRTVFIAAKQKEGTDKADLENAMINTIKRQAKTKGYQW